MSADEIIRKINGSSFFQSISKQLNSGGNAAVNLPASSIRLFLYSIVASNGKNPLLIVVADTRKAKEYAYALKLLVKNTIVDVYPALDFLPGEQSENYDLIGKRLEIANALLSGKQRIMIAPVRSLFFKTSRPEGLSRDKIILSVGVDDYKPQELAQKLINMGYQYSQIVGSRGECCMRGGIMDIFPTNSMSAVRVEFSGDQIVSMRIFDTHTQLSSQKIEQAEILSAKEENQITLIELLPVGSKIFMDEPQSIKISAQRFEGEITRSDITSGSLAGYDELISQMQRFGFTQISSLGNGEKNTIEAPPQFNKNLDALAEHLSQSEMDIYLFSEHLERVHAFLQDKIPEKTSRLHFIKGPLSGGFLIKPDNLELLTDREIFNEVIFSQKDAEAYHQGVNRDLLVELKKDEYVVHENYGIGIYRGLEKLEIEDVLHEYLLVEYDQGEKLYVPLAQMGLVKKYSSGGEYHPKISRLSAAEWKKTKSRVKKGIRDMTRELLNLYAYRAKESGFPFSPDNVYQRELESTFAYDETQDQIKAISQIKEDMESSRVMDRLLCGDVGYGKTEVAIRAAVKAASSAKQAAMLVPTTILAHQHHANFSERLKSLPFKVEVLSRFKTKSEQKTIIDELAAGNIDIIIGTHRILQKDIKFRDLGLLIIDEEHRFGVGDKEKLKQFKKSVDVLSLSATPIPRTLYFSLSGVRDISIINTPPLDRLPIKTHVLEYSDAIVQEAIRREMERGGQVFYVYNFVETINTCAAKVKQLVPEARIKIAHGQMHEKDLEIAMVDFMEGKFDVLISTTIIESGLDIPNANTIIIDHAHRFGLAELYQLRGRVGRSTSRAYAYLLFHSREVQTQEAYKRLLAIQDFTHLGSGYQLALKDMEIRGTGNLLGAQQHGHMLAVGFDLYCEMIEQAVNEIKGIKEIPAQQVVLDLGIEAFIPDSYITDEKQRIAVYRRMNLFSDISELRPMRDELVDRFGKIPEPLQKLFKVIELKILARNAGVQNIKREKNNLIITMFDRERDKTLASSLRKNYPDKKIKLSEGKIKISVENIPIEDWLKRLSCALLDKE